jgi:hypothetical protein
MPLFQMRHLGAETMTNRQTPTRESLIDWITSQGWTVDWNSSEGHIEFRHKEEPTFWRPSIREAVEYLGGPA